VITRKALTISAVAAFAALALAACSSPSGSTGSSDKPAADPTSLTLALVPSQDQAGLVDTAKPLTDMLTKALGIPVTGVVSKDYQAAVEAMGADQAQIGFLPSLQLWQASDKYGAKVVLQTERDGNITYPAQFMTNNPDKYCNDKPVEKNGMLFCNGADADHGPAGLSSIKKVTGGVKVAVLGPGSPAGYIYPILALKNAGVDTDKDITQVPVTANDAAVLAVYNGDAEVGFSFWDARTIITDKPDVGKKVVVFALTDEIPNDGVALTKSLSPKLQNKITKALEDYSNTPDGSKVLTSIYSITKLAPANPKTLTVVADAAKKLGLQ
jgi:phosphonate transport system substrate-binding protein